MSEISRRRFLSAAATLPLAAMLPKGFLARALAGSGLLFFDEHQASVVREATARLIPGPADDPLEALGGHAGAREANVVRYIDLMLGAFAVDPPRIFAGGPWSDRHGSTTNHLASFVPLTALQDRAWRSRIAALQKAYRDGIVALDEAAGGDFTAASPVERDRILADAGDFTGVLFTNAIEGFLSNPEYGGNADAVGWKEISFRGDTQPAGWTPSDVGESDGLDPAVTDALVTAVIANFEVAARALAARWGRGR